MHQESGFTRRQFVMAAPLALGVLALAGCSSDAGSTAPQDNAGTQGPQPAQEAPATPLDLTGEWVQSNSNSDQMKQKATIGADTIRIVWLQDDGSEALYWAGSYAAPSAPADTYTWESANDANQTGTALLASHDETKSFTYANDRISYEVSAFGATVTVELART